jgi:hypothetical protein
MRPQVASWPSAVPVVTFQPPPVASVLKITGTLASGLPEVNRTDSLACKLARLLLAERSVAAQGVHPIWCWVDDGRRVCRATCTTPGCRYLHVPPGFTAIRAIVPLWRGVLVDSSSWQSICGAPALTGPEGNSLVTGTDPNVLIRRLTYSPPSSEIPVRPTEFIMEMIHGREVIDMVEGGTSMDVRSWYSNARLRGMPELTAQMQMRWHITRTKAHWVPKEDSAIVTPEVRGRTAAEHSPSYGRNTSSYADDGADASACTVLSVGGMIDAGAVLRAVSPLVDERATTAAALLDAPGLNQIARLDWVRRNLHANVVRDVADRVATAATQLSSDPERTSAMIRIRACELLVADRRRNDRIKPMWSIKSAS